MRMPLAVRLALAFLLTAGIAFTLLATWEVSLLHRQAETEVRNELSRDASFIADVYAKKTSSYSPELLAGIAEASGSEIWIMNTRGRVVAVSGNREVPFDVTEFRVSDGTNGYYVVGKFYDLFEEETLSVYKSLAQDGEVRGYVVLHYPMSAVLRDAERMQFFAYMTFWIFIVLLTLLYFWIYLTMVRPIRKVAEAGHEYANMNLTYPNPVQRNDEIGDIALAEADLAKQLKNSADDQRRFLQNISHDFRSPLTSIRGYMVAIQDGTIPPEHADKYLNIAIGETDRLANLANDLLDITQLSNGVLNCTSFDLNELIRELLPTFEGRVEEKNITFDVTFEHEEEYVTADRERIEQVLHNLTDNAIKFSPQDSVIEFSTRLVGAKVFVSVKDHGVGIEKENLEKIWTRFYKTDASRGKDKKGSGLGLSIVRDIIQNHQEQIDVISTPGVGTEFVFTLPSTE